MLIIISSAKTQHYRRPSGLPVSQPLLLDQAARLAHRCRQLSKEEIASLMKVSDKIAATTWQRFQDFSLPHETGSASPALTTFSGDVFSEIKHETFSSYDWLFAQRRLRVISGLYGLLRPLDLMQCYRLEMGYKIGIGDDANLYDYWSEAVTGLLNRDLAEIIGATVLNCASKEYSRIVLSDKLNAPMLTLTFKQLQNNRVRSIAIYAKRARGMFVDWFIRNRIAKVDQLKNFDRGGYSFAPELSNDSELVFVTRLD